MVSRIKPEEIINYDKITCSQEKLSLPNWVLSPNWAFAPSLFLTNPPTRFTPPLPLHLHAYCPTKHPPPYMPMPFIFLLTYSPSLLPIYLPMQC